MTKKLKWETVSTKGEPNPYKMKSGPYLINGNSYSGVTMTLDGEPFENPGDIHPGHPEWSEFPSIWAAMGAAERHHNAA
jgi:hypothetical protein